MSKKVLGEIIPVRVTVSPVASVFSGCAETTQMPTMAIAASVQEMINDRFTDFPVCSEEATGILQ